jgi:hypothetical protein
MPATSMNSHGSFPTGMSAPDSNFLAAISLKSLRLCSALERAQLSITYQFMADTELLDTYSGALYRLTMFLQQDLRYHNRLYQHNPELISKVDGLFSSTPKLKDMNDFL